MSAMTWPRFEARLVAERAGGRCECDGRCNDKRCAGGRCLEVGQRRSPVGGRRQAVAHLCALSRVGAPSSRQSRRSVDYVVLCQHCREGVA